MNDTITTVTKWIVAFLIIFLLLMILLFTFFYKKKNTPLSTSHVAYS